ncbi:cation transporter [Cupriavidus metallidurans]|uniref:cation transporter n=1 Tax=Cupriavidus metallidurans TaxID=119219 RepID=UPI0035C73CA2
MDQCCNDKADAAASLRVRQGRVLYLVLAINAVMFVVEFGAGWLAQSTALLGDSLDMGDASVYAVTLYALTASDRTRAGIALFKGLAMAVLGLAVLIEAARKAVVGATPDVGVMILVGVVALMANAVCFALPFRHRADDLNMRSVWLCSRNDLISNTSVLLAAGVVYASGSMWPDVVIGVAIALLFLHSARQVLAAAWDEWQSTPRISSMQRRTTE